MIYFLDRLAEFETGVQGCDCHLHKINADVGVVCNRCRKKHCICTRFFQSSLFGLSHACDTNFESIHEDVALAWYLFVSRSEEHTSELQFQTQQDGRENIS